MLFLCWRSCAIVHSGSFFGCLFDGICVDLGIHTDVEVHNDICHTGSLTAFLEVRPRAEPSGTRVPEYQEDADIEEIHKRWCVNCRPWMPQDTTVTWL